MRCSSATLVYLLLPLLAAACESHGGHAGATQGSTGSDDAGDGTSSASDEPGDTTTDASTTTGVDAGTSDGGSDDGGSDDGAPVFDGCGDLGAAHELVALGHRSTPTLVAVTAERVLAGEDDARWILWDVPSASIVARGFGRVVGRGGGRFMVDVGDALEPSATGFELRSFDDGALQVAIDAPHRDGGIAQDGSYAWTHDAQALALWNVDGTPRAVVDGIVTGDRGLALPDTWLGPDDAGTMHRVDAGTGEVELASFVGAFRGYFADHEHYVTAGSGLMAIYPMAGGDAVAVHDLPPGTTLGGASGWLWRWFGGGRNLDVFDMHDTSAPVLSLTDVGPDDLLPAGRVLVLTDRDPATLTLVELSEGLPVARSIPAPRQRFESVAAGDGLLALGAARGALWTMQADSFSPLGPGQPLSLSGADNGWVAAAFEVDGLRIFDAEDGTAVAAIDAEVSKVVMQSDGLAVAALDNTWLDEAARVRVFALPDGQLGHAVVGDDVRDFELSRHGSHLVRMRLAPPRHVELTALTDDAVVYDAAAIDDERLALAPGGAALTRSTAEPLTRFIVDGALVNAVDGRALGFVDDERLVFDAGGATLELRTPSGSWIGDTPIPADVDGVLPVGDGRVYAIGAHRLYDLDAGVELPWSDAPPDTTGIAAIAGRFVVHTTCDGTRLVATPR
ncbi:MAG: hypothetical protein IPK74_20910 [Deltaproteobacteria bacterium]|nr:hypothetical protein [Deltaproteobacteria bacterium]